MSEQLSGVVNERIIRFGNYTYSYYVGYNIWSAFLTRIEEVNADHIVIVVEHSFPVFLAEMMSKRIASISRCTLLTFKAGEREKTLAAIEGLAEQAFRVGITRQSCILALGGGLTGNIAGLLASLLFRGIRLIHVPTTLLAMSDSVLSIKQAVNALVGKNLIGTFYAPEFVWSDLSYLNLLPKVEVRSALCELIKNVLAICPEHFLELVSVLNPEGLYTVELYERFIELSIEAKSSVMLNDPKEQNDGLVLEYGHTVGHALEFISHGSISHGYAVGLGMLVAARISNMLGRLTHADVDVHVELLALNGAMTSIPQRYSVTDIISAIKFDNKRGYLKEIDGTCAMVLLDKLGNPSRKGTSILINVPIELLLAGIEMSY